MASGFFSMKLVMLEEILSGRNNLIAMAKKENIFSLQRVIL